MCHLVTNQKAAEWNWCNDKIIATEFVIVLRVYDMLYYMIYDMLWYMIWYNMIYYTTFEVRVIIIRFGTRYNLCNGVCTRNIWYALWFDIWYTIIYEIWYKIIWYDVTWYHLMLFTTIEVSMTTFSWKRPATALPIWGHERI